MSSVNSMKQFQTFFGLSIAEKSTGIVFVSLDATSTRSSLC